MLILKGIVSVFAVFCIALGAFGAGGVFFQFYEPQILGICSLFRSVSYLRQEISSGEVCFGSIKMIGAGPRSI